METLRSTAFAKKFEIDDREPQIFFSVPYGGSFGIAVFDLTFWGQLFLLLLLESILN